MRDLDVLIDDLVAPLQQAAPHFDVAALVAVLEVERADVRATARKQLRSKASKALRTATATLPDHVSTRLTTDRKTERIGKLARRDLRRRWRKVTAQAATIETANPEDLHVLRKAIKNLRYTFDHFAPFSDAKHAAAFNEQLRRLQATFGYLNDVTNARTLTARLEAGTLPAPLGYAIGFVLGWHSERAQHIRHRLHEQWQDLAETKIAQDLARD